MTTRCQGTSSPQRARTWPTNRGEPEPGAGGDVAVAHDRTGRDRVHDVEDGPGLRRRFVHGPASLGVRRPPGVSTAVTRRSCAGASISQRSR